MKESNYWGTPHTNPRMPLDGMEDKKPKPKTNPIKNARAKKIKKEEKYTNWTADGLKNPAIKSWSCAFAVYEDKNVDTWRSEWQIKESAGLEQMYATAKNKRDYVRMPGAYGIKVKGANIKGRAQKVSSDLNFGINLRSSPVEIANLTLRGRIDERGAIPFSFDMNIFASIADGKGSIYWTAGVNGQKPAQKYWKALKRNLTSFGFTESFADLFIDSRNTGWGQDALSMKEAKGFIQGCRNNAPPPSDLPYYAIAESLEEEMHNLWYQYKESMENLQDGTNWEVDKDSPYYLKDYLDQRKEFDEHMKAVRRILEIAEEFYPKNYAVLIAKNKKMPKGKKPSGYSLLDVLENMDNMMNLATETCEENIKTYTKMMEKQNELAEEIKKQAEMIGDTRYGMMRPKSGPGNGTGYLSRNDEPRYEFGAFSDNYSQYAKDNYATPIQSTTAEIN